MFNALAHIVRGELGLRFHLWASKATLALREVEGEERSRMGAAAQATDVQDQLQEESTVQDIRYHEMQQESFVDAPWFNSWCATPRSEDRSIAVNLKGKGFTSAPGQLQRRERERTITESLSSLSSTDVAYLETLPMEVMASDKDKNRYCCAFSVPSNSHIFSSSSLSSSGSQEQSETALKQEIKTLHAELWERQAALLALRKQPSTATARDEIVSVQADLSGLDRKITARRLRLQAVLDNKEPIGADGKAGEAGWSHHH